MSTPSSEPLSRKQKSQLAQRVTIQGMILDVVLGVLKIVIGSISSSYALIADGIHSFTDAASDIMVILITRFSHRKPDEDHPYGHGKFETLGTVVLGSLLIAVAGAMAWDSVSRLASGEADVVPGWPALLAAGLSIAGKEWIFRYTLKVGKQLHSDLIIANAWHSRSDAFSSVIVLFALVGAMLGYPWLDAVAAIAVALLVGKIGWGLAWNSIQELVETAVPADMIQSFHEAIQAVPGVRDAHYLRGRYVGPDIVLDLHLQVDPTISVSEGHQIGLRVVDVLHRAHQRISDITLHIDAEADGNIEDQLQTSAALPEREEITALLSERWKDILPPDSIRRIILHYLRDKIHLEVMLSDQEELLPPTPLHDVLLEKLSDQPWLGSLRLWVART